MKQIYPVELANEKFGLYMLSKEDQWKPLYKCLKHLFHEDYQEAANSFMYMSTRKVRGGFVHFYKHGITRRSFALDDEGNPWDYVDESDDEIIYKPMSFEEAFKDVYKDLEKFSFIDQDNPYFTKYSEYKKVRDKELKKAGYNVITTNIDDFEKDLNNNLNLKEIRKIVRMNLFTL
jgi:hypothetical protein